jgi:hypothetical protein
LVWAVLFTLMHGYWFLGGRYGLGDAPDPVPPGPHDLVTWIFTVVVLGMFVVGLATPAVLLRDRARGRWRRLLVLLLWFGCVLLVLRGVSGLVDDLARGSGLSPRGITGLTDEQVLGTAHPSTYTLMSTASIDAYFTLGGVLYGWAARATGRAGSARARRA